MVRLSILIPSIPSRFDKSVNLYYKLLEMVGDKEIELLMITDNKYRSIGAKRESLKNLSQGDYFMIVDDDDELLSLDEIYKATHQDVDVITFKQRCRNEDGSEFVVTFGLGNEVEHNKNEQGFYVDCKRPAFQMCAWNKRFKNISYPDINYGEDGVWMEQANKLAESEVHIDKIVHSYNFDSSVSEASTENNQHWTNPNHESNR